MGIRQKLVEALLPLDITYYLGSEKLFRETLTLGQWRRRGRELGIDPFIDQLKKHELTPCGNASRKSLEEGGIRVDAPVIVNGNQMTFTMIIRPSGWRWPRGFRLPS